MNWQITLPSSNAQASVSAQLVASGYQDYRAGNNTVEKTVTVSSLADVWLLNHGVSTEKAADAVAGDAWLFLAYGNASTLQNSSNLTLRISHNGDYQLLDDAGLNCTSSGSDYLCSLTGLTTSSSYERRLKLHSPAAQSGTITASLVSPSGFPLDRIAGSAAVNFYQPAGGDTGEIPRDPDPDPGTDPGAGPEVPEGTPMDTGSAAFFLFFLPLLLCRRR